MKIHHIDLEYDFIRAVVDYIIRMSNAAAVEKRPFHFVLTGGETPIEIYRHLTKVVNDWSNWHFWISDERIGTPELSNSKIVRENLLDHIDYKEVNVHLIKSSGDVVSSVSDYAKVLRNVGDFDLVLLGVGEDGHTASLFPGNDWGLGQESLDVLGIYNSPKAPPHRVSLSAARLKRSKSVIFIAKGKNKASIIEQIEKHGNYPVNSIRGQDSSVLFYCHDDY